MRDVSVRLPRGKVVKLQPGARLEWPDRHGIDSDLTVLALTKEFAMVQRRNAWPDVMRTEELIRGPWERPWSVEAPE